MGGGSRPCLPSVTIRSQEGRSKRAQNPPIFAVEHSWHPALSPAALGTKGFARTHLRQGAPAHRPPPPPVLLPSLRSLLRPLLWLRPWLLQVWCTPGWGRL